MIIDRFRKIDHSAIDHLFEPITHRVQRYRFNWNNFTLTRFCIIAANVLFTYVLMKYFHPQFGTYVIIGIMGMGTMYSLWRTARVERLVMPLLGQGLKNPCREKFILSRAVDWSTILGMVIVTFWLKRALPLTFVLAVTFYVSEEYFLACTPLQPGDEFVPEEKLGQNC
jgi:hypothetical protein